MYSIRSVLPQVLRKRGLMRHAEASRLTFVAERWLAATLPALRGALAVERVQDGTLMIGCSHSIAAQECQFVVPALLTHLQRECGAQALTEVRVVRTRAGRVAA